MKKKIDYKVQESEDLKRNELKEKKPYVYEKILKFEEKVKRGESFAIIQFQYNYACNFNCVHCGISQLRKPGARSFTPEDVKELSRQADEMGLAHFVITGGEPLVFPDLDEVIKAIDPQKFYISLDTNGWYFDEEKAFHLKELGVDKIQLSLDSLNEIEHDEFRKKKGSHARALRAIDAAKKAGLNIIIQTVVTKQRVYSEEFEEFLKFLNSKDVGVFVTYAKPVGNWEGNYDVLVTKKDMDYVRELEKKYNVFTHLTPGYGLDLGCIAVKRMISVTQYGDVMPCPYIHASLGNVFEEPLKDIIERGLKIKWFGKYVDTCLIAEDKHFIEEYDSKRIYGNKPLPVPWFKVFDENDYIKDEEKLKTEKTKNGYLRWRK
ncbi:radical SAM/SPASM domain-containing protein [Marinitoga sp. 1155]|uniref:radical SAM/SPASM domain-containing protein n=1 Tax=Marinitoga sp. 1155 TaxID=1428448 RepID=UPI000658F59A|nr:radical SAM protein [Marinitoga sp. 1155]KLO21686.1 Fe-S osidoreductase [Marinitoga sp. 1155]